MTKMILVFFSDHFHISYFVIEISRRVIERKYVVAHMILESGRPSAMASRLSMELVYADEGNRAMHAELQIYRAIRHSQ